MRPAFRPRLINDPFSDPGLFVPFHYERRALLFDLGDLSNLTNRELLSISHVFVSHTHIDHFIGFDSLLRPLLGREKTLHLFGPAGFFERVEGKLAGYTWNLVTEYEHDLVFVVTEVREGQRVTRRYSFKAGFKKRGADVLTPPTGPVFQEPRFRVHSQILEHRIPCLAFSLEERFHINIDKVALDSLGLPVGPWLNDFKAALYRGEDPRGVFHVTWPDEKAGTRVRSFALGDLRDKIAIFSPGRKVAYVTDASPLHENFRKIEALAEGADHLYIEGTFHSEDEDLARQKCHLTAARAGALAGKAGVRGFTLFHFSPRYLGREEDLQKEAMEAYSKNLST